MDTGTIIAIVISGAAFLTAVIGPLLTAWIQCRHESKMYEKRFKIEHEHEVIERYLKAAGKLALSTQDDDMKDFGEASAEIFMYAPSEFWDDIRKLNDGIVKIRLASKFEDRKSSIAEIQILYFSLCEKFSAFRRTSKYIRRRNRKKNK